MKLKSKALDYELTALPLLKLGRFLVFNFKEDNF
jgi:hypothetical protein